MVQRRSYAALLLVAALLVSACGGAAEVGTNAQESAPSETAPVTSTVVAPDTAAPATTDLVNLVGGGQLDLNSIEGTDTVLWFWAPW